MRECSKCGRTLQDDSFCFKNKKKNKRQSACNECNRQYTRKHYRRNVQYYVEKKNRKAKETKQKIVDYLLGKACFDCGETDIRVLQFDHRDPLLKEFSIADTTKGCSWNRIIAEIEKCDIRCANCHIKRSTAQFGWFRGGHHL